jgi:hypothetical protein
MMVWRYSDTDNPNIYFQLSDDLQTWTEPETIAGIYGRSITDCSIDDYELQTDALGTVHHVVVGHHDIPTTANPSLFHLEFRQGRWGAVQRLFYSSEEQPEWPKSAFGPQGDIHLTWFVRSIPEDAGLGTSCTQGLKVYYSHRDPVLANQPTLAFNPTHTPQPTPTLMEVLEPTATPLPQVKPVEGPVINTTRDIYAIQTVGGGILFVALLCGSIIALTRFLRR